MLAFVLTFGIAFALALVLTPLALRFGNRFDIVSVPGGRYQGHGRLPRTGGLAIYLAFTAAAIIAQFLPVERTDPKEVTRFAGLILGGTVVYFLWLLDDKVDLPASVQFLGQFIAGAIAVGFLIIIESFNNPFTGQPVSTGSDVMVYLVSAGWIILMMNTVNFLDGSDGLAAGVVAIAALMIFIHSAFELNQVSVSLLPLALFGATLGFLPYNFHPARIIMGGGAQFLGYTLAVLSVIGGAKMATILLVMGLPLMDLGWQASRRIMTGQHPFRGDRGHLHFRLIDSGVSPRLIALGYYAFCGVFGFIALTTASQLFKLIALGVMGAIVLAVFIIMTIQERHE
jgi:UDP-GlcNAc:undecaprenyl-phosphate GlcNAc-1-phosphate transferase